MAEEKGLDISELSLADLQSIDTHIGEDVIVLLDNRASMNAHQSQGGTATMRTLEEVEGLKVWLKQYQ